MSIPVILITCFDFDAPQEWFFPYWALLTERPTVLTKKARLITWHNGGVRMIDEYHIDHRNSAHCWAYLSEIDKLRANFASGFRHEEQLARLEKLVKGL